MTFKEFLSSAIVTASVLSLIGWVFYVEHQVDIRSGVLDKPVELKHYVQEQNNTFEKLHKYTE